MLFLGCCLGKFCEVKVLGNNYRFGVIFISLSVVKRVFAHYPLYTCNKMWFQMHSHINESVVSGEDEQQLWNIWATSHFAPFLDIKPGHRHLHLLLHRHHDLHDQTINKTKVRRLLFSIKNQNFLEFKVNCLHQVKNEGIARLHTVWLISL